MPNKEKIYLAEKLIEKALEFQAEGKIDKAIKLFLQSLDIYKSAETYRLLGFAYSLQNKYEQALQQCFYAVEMIGEDGILFNDIGTYLIKLGRYIEAALWLEKALKIDNFSEKFNSFYNLGLVSEKTGDWENALKNYNISLSMAPDFELAKTAIVRIVSLMN